MSDEPLYYAVGRTVHKRPIEIPQPDRSARITMGFPVCTVSEYLNADDAGVVAHMLNVAEDVGALARAPGIAEALAALLQRMSP